MLAIPRFILVGTLFLSFNTCDFITPTEFLMYMHSCQLKIFLTSSTPHEDTILKLLGNEDGVTFTATLMHAKLISNIYWELDDTWTLDEHFFDLTRHTQCFIHLYLTAIDQKPFPDSNILASVSIKWLATYVIPILQLNEHHNMSMIQEEFRRYYTAPGIIVVNESLHLFEICHYTTADTYWSSESNFESSCHTGIDFQQSFIVWPLSDTVAYDTSLFSCNPTVSLARRQAVPVVHCVTATMAKKFNISMTPTTNYIGMVNWEYHVSNTFARAEMQLVGNAIVESSVMYESWGHLIIKTNLANDISMNKDVALRNPYDTPTCVLVVICYVLLSLLMILQHFLWVQGAIQTSRVLILDASVGPVRLFGSFLEQSSCPPPNVRSTIGLNAVCHSGIWLIWYFTVYIISEAYKGTVFSQMTISKKLEYPMNLKELAELNATILTFTKAWFHGREYLVKGTILDFIQSGNCPRYYNQLESNILDEVDFNLDMTNLSVMLHWYQNGLKISSDDSIYKNDTIGELDLLKEVQTHKQILEVFTPSISTSPVVESQTFMTCIPWTTTRNVIYPLLKEVLGQMLENGLYNRWRIIHEDIKVLQSLYDVEMELIQRQDSSSIQLGVPKSNWWNHYVYQKSQRNKIMTESPAPLQFTVVRYTFIVWVFMLLISVVVLTLEIFHLYINHINVLAKA